MPKLINFLAENTVFLIIPAILFSGHRAGIPEVATFPTHPEEQAVHPEPFETHPVVHPEPFETHPVVHPEEQQGCVSKGSKFWGDIIGP